MEGVLMVDSWAKRVNRLSYRNWSLHSYAGSPSTVTIIYIHVCMSRKGLLNGSRVNDGRRHKAFGSARVIPTS